MKKLKVIQIIDSLDVGGAETLAVNIANSLKKKGVYSSLCATRKEGKLKSVLNNDVAYLYLERKKIIDIKAIIKLLKFISKHKITTIHAHSSSLYVSTIVKICRPKLKLIWHNHYGMNVNNNSISLKICSFFVSTIINVSEDLEKWSQKKLYAKRTIYLPNFGKFNSEEKSTILKGDNGKRLVHLGGFRYEKDHINLLESFMLLKRNHPDWTLHLIGKDYEDNYSAAVYQFIEEHQLRESIFIYGLQTDVKNILDQSTIGVLSSLSEGLPISLIEFGMMRKPVVCTNVGQCSEIVTTKELVVPPKNSKALCSAIELLINNEEFFNAEKNKIYLTVMNKFSEDQFTEKLINLYNA
ncbi:MAG: glycosyltransferase [Flavobacteriaceae bacterium]